MFAHEEYSRSGYLDYEWVEDLNIYYYHLFTPDLPCKKMVST